MSIAGILRRWTLVSAVTGVLALIQVPGVRAQAVQPVQMPPNPNPNQPVPMIPSPGPNQPVQMPPNPNQPVPMAPSPGPNQPVPMVPSPGPLNSPANGDTGAPGMAPGIAPEMAPGMAPGTPPQAPVYSPTGLSPLEVIWRSLTDSIYEPADQARWTPLPLATFFTEGWDQPFVLPTTGGGGFKGSGGSPRFGWFNDFGGTNYRAWFFELFYANNVLGSHYRSNGNLYLLDWTIFVPFNRRFEIEFDWTTIISNKGGSNDTYHGNIGDITVTPRFQLSETKNLGTMFLTGIRLPTGAHDNGSGVANLQPRFAYWWNFWGNWVCRGNIGATVPTNHGPTSGYTSFNNFLGIGYYLKGRDDALLHNAQVFMVTEVDATTTGTPRRESFFSLLPGFLTQVGPKLNFAYACIEVPMVGPKAYTYQMIWAYVRAF
jgi:hypothetical protein